MTTPLEKAQSAERSARRRAERASAGSDGIMVEPEPAPGPDHFLEQYEAEQEAARKAEQEAREAEEREAEERSKAAAKAARTRRRNAKDAEE